MVPDLILWRYRIFPDRWLRLCCCTKSNGCPPNLRRHFSASQTLPPLVLLVPRANTFLAIWYWLWKLSLLQWNPLHKRYWCARIGVIIQVHVVGRYIEAVVD